MKATFAGKFLFGISLSTALVSVLLIPLMTTRAQAAGGAPAPLAQWSFDEGTGTAVHDVLGNNAGILVNSPSWVSGKNGTALDFKNDSMVQVSSASIINNLSSFTVVAWVNPRQGGRIITKGDTRPVRFYLAIAPKGSGGLDFGVGYDGTIDDWTTAPGVVSSNAWHLVAVSYTYGQRPSMYIDGVLQTITQASSPTGNPEPDNASLYIGNRGDNVATFDGQIDDVQIYGQILSADSIRAIYQGGQTPAPTVTLTQSSATTTSDRGAGQAFSISWSSTNATSCVVQKTNPAGALANPWATGTVGSQDASSPMVGVHHWWIDCTGAGGTTHKDLYHAVLSPALASQSNIVVIMTDDQDDQGSIDVMKQVQSLLKAQGVTFTNSFSVNPLCCSSRASFLTGQYSHNDGVWQNARNANGFDGGYGALAPTDGNTLPVWMQAAGYRTGLIGKYLNQYGTDVPQTYVPPGWTTWNGLVDPTTYAYYNYTINENGTLHAYGTTPADYQTDVLANKAVDFITASSNSSQPFFLWLTPLAPHAAASATNTEYDFLNPTPAPKYAGYFGNLSLPQGPSFNEGDVSDKPTFIQNLPLMNVTMVSTVTKNYQMRREALLSVDDMVAQVVDALTKAGKINNTYIIFTSDNGYFQGQHRLPIEKRLGYEESIKVPLIIKGPGVTAGQTNSALVANIDLSATILEIARATAGRAQDGRSLVPYLSGNTNSSRADLLIEGTDKVPFDTTFYSSFAGVRTSRFVYIEHKTLSGSIEKELYDLVRDPYELQSLQADAKYITIMQKLANELSLLRACQGSGCWMTASTITPADLAVLPTAAAAANIGAASASTAAIPKQPGELEETNLSAAQKDAFYRADGNSPPMRSVVTTGSAVATASASASVSASAPAGQQAALPQVAFSRTLRLGMSGRDVAKLQTILAKDPSIYPEGLITGYFGPVTKRAVIRFQEKYASEILFPVQLSKGTGIVGPATIKKLNQLQVF